LSANHANLNCGGYCTPAIISESARAILAAIIGWSSLDRADHPDFPPKVDAGENSSPRAGTISPLTHLGLDYWGSKII
jgi:hypothetical protein